MKLRPNFRALARMYISAQAFEGGFRFDKTTSPKSLEMAQSLHYTGFIQASLIKIQGLFKDYSRLLQFSRTNGL